MKRILIAGCGYVGSRLAADLLAAGHTVFGLRRNAAALPPPIEPLAADLADPATLRDLPADLDAVVYAAAADERSDAAYRRAYSTGTANLVAALASAARPPRRLLFVSSTGVFGGGNGTWVDEDSPPQPDGPGAWLLDGERIVATAPFQGVILRLAGIYGPGRTHLLDQVRRGAARFHAAPALFTNRIHRDDCAGAIHHLLQLPQPAPLYLGVDDEPATEETVLRFLAAELGAPEPLPAADASARGAGRRCSNRRLRASGFAPRYPSFREGYRAILAAREPT